MITAFGKASFAVAKAIVFAFSIQVALAGASNGIAQGCIDRGGPELKKIDTFLVPSIDNINFPSAINICRKAIEADPDNNDLKYILAKLVLHQKAAGGQDLSGTPIGPRHHIHRAASMRVQNLNFVPTKSALQQAYVVPNG